MATTARRLITVDEFLKLEFDPECKAELSNGIIHVVRMMGGGSGAHARVQGNIFGNLFVQLRGTGCRPFGPDMGVRSHELSMRLPDISVFCNRTSDENDRVLVFDDPKMLVEVLSPSTLREDLFVKLPEYMSVPSVDAILYVEPIDEELTLYLRDERRGWAEHRLSVNEDVVIPQLGIRLSRTDIFGRD